MSQIDIAVLRAECEEKLQTGCCIVCDKACGHAAPRQAVIAHMRSSTDADHVAWRNLYWHLIFKRGNKAKAAPTKQDALQHVLRFYTREQLRNLIEMEDE